MTPKFPWLSVIFDLALTLYLMYTVVFPPEQLSTAWNIIRVLVIFGNGTVLGRHWMRHKCLKVFPGVLKEYEKALKSEQKIW